MSLWLHILPSTSFPHNLFTQNILILLSHGHSLKNGVTIFTVAVTLLLVDLITTRDTLANLDKKTCQERDLNVQTTNIYLPHNQKYF
jgi:hypothetical protein